MVRAQDVIQRNNYTMHAWLTCNAPLFRRGFQNQINSAWWYLISLAHNFPILEPGTVNVPMLLLLCWAGLGWDTFPFCASINRGLLVAKQISFEGSQFISWLRAVQPAAIPCNRRQNGRSLIVGAIKSNFVNIWFGEQRLEGFIRANFPNDRRRIHVRSKNVLISYV